MKKLFITSIFTTLLFPINALAQQTENEVIVVANLRIATNVDKMGSSIKVIAGEEIAKIQPIQLIDVLYSTTGLNISRTGGYGQPTSIFMRGGESHDTKIIFDGVTLVDPSLPAGNFDFGNLMISDVERIEIFKGPQSALYGSDAIGGVINIISKAPTTLFEANANFEFGTLNTQSARLSFSGRKADLSYRISAYDFQTDGISAKAKAIGGNETEKYKNNGVYGQLSYNLNDNLALNLRAGYGHAKTGFDGFPAPFYAFADTNEYSETNLGQYYVALKSNNFDERLKSIFSFYAVNSDRKNFDPLQTPKTTYIAHGKDETIEYQGNYSLGANSNLLFGLLANKQNYSSRSPSIYDPNPTSSGASATTNSGYAELRIEPITGLNATFGIRNDNHSRFGDKSSIRATFSYSPNDGVTRIHANYGEGFKAPSLFQLFSDYGNPALKPESANAIEIGLSHRFSKYWRASIIGFSREASNQIDFFSCFGTTAPLCASRPYGFYDNIKSANAEGIEIEGAGRIGDFSIEAGYSLVRADNTTITSVNFGKSLARRPRNSANILMSYDWGNEIKTSLSYNYVGERFNDAANFTRLAPYSLFGLRTSWMINEKVELYGRIENLLDQEYVVVSDYGTMPRTYNIGLRLSF